MAYGDFKDVPRKTITNKLLLNKVFNSEKNPKYYGYQQRLCSNFVIFWAKRLIIQKKD